MSRVKLQPMADGVEGQTRKRTEPTDPAAFSDNKGNTMKKLIVGAHVGTAVLTTCALAGRHYA